MFRNMMDRYRLQTTCFTSSLTQFIKFLIIDPHHLLDKTMIGYFIAMGCWRSRLSLGSLVQFGWIGM